MKSDFFPVFFLVDIEKNIVYQEHAMLFSPSQLNKHKNVM